MTTSFDEQGIREAITFYADGMRTGDVETLKRGFHEQAILCGYLGDDLIAGVLVRDPRHRNDRTRRHGEGGPSWRRIGL